MGPDKFWTGVGALTSIGWLLAGGCSFGSQGTGTDLAITDSGIVADAPTADTAVADVSPEDSQDSQATLDVSEGGSPDIAGDGFDDVPDAEADVGSPVLTMSGAKIATGSLLDLATEGSVGWAHWGLDTTASFNHKKGSSLITTGPAAGASQWPYYSLKISWTDGEPTSSVAETRSGILQLKKGDGLGFQVDGATLKGKVRIYVSCYQCTGTIRVSLTGAPSVEASLPAPGDTNDLERWTVDFSTPSPSAVLSVSLVKTNIDGSLGLLAATVAP